MLIRKTQPLAKDTLPFGGDYPQVGKIRVEWGKRASRALAGGASRDRPGNLYRLLLCTAKHRQLERSINSTGRVMCVGCFSGK